MMLIPGMEEQLKKVRLFTANVFGRTNVTYNSNCYLEKHRFFLKIIILLLAVLHGHD